MADRRTLYPPIEPMETGRLKVSDLHEVYFEVSGNPNGKPVIVCHGGPGGGSTGSMRRYFDPKAYRIVLFDQRGCGRSTPHAELRENTTWDLVSDMEKLRVHLGIERWQVFGGSWGSTLSLAYAETHPDRVTELVLRGIFTIRKSEIDWFYQAGADWFYPDAWEGFLAPIPEAERGDLLSAYHKRRGRTDRLRESVEPVGRRRRLHQSVSGAGGEFRRQSLRARLRADRGALLHQSRLL